MPLSFLSLLLLSYPAHAADGPVPPICRAAQAQESHERKLAKDLQARAKGLELHQDQAAVREALRAHLACLASVTDKAQALCRKVKNSPRLRVEKELEAAQRGASGPHCSYFGALSSIEGKNWEKLDDLVIDVDQLLPVYRHCVRGIDSKLLAIVHKLRPISARKKFIEAMHKVNAFPATVTLAPELKADRDRRAEERQRSREIQEELTLRYKKCVEKAQKDAELPKIRRMR